MTPVGVVGLGKLGLPVACAMASRGVDVIGYDIRASQLRFPRDTSHEQGLAETIEQARPHLTFARALSDLATTCDVIFVAVETPHNPRFEGVTPIPQDRANFDYTALKLAVGRVAHEAFLARRHVTISVISTVLPGTMAREIVPLLGGYASIVYNPSFIAMGTTVRDFLDPEFVLLGGDGGPGLDDVIKVYQRVYGVGAPYYETTVENAELIKVAYNTFIGMKIAFANTLMEVCHKTGCDVDEVTGALKLAHRRLISGAYMDGGMGDGGGCHPRDNIALSWLARELDLSHDLFEDVMRAREDQSVWLAELMDGYRLPKALLGVAYKPGSHITTGSPALLVKHILQERGHHVWWCDPHAAPANATVPDGPHVFLVGCKHPEFAGYTFPAGSVVIDPFRYIPDQPDVEVVRLGEGQRPVPHHGKAGESGSVPAKAA